MRGGLGSKIDRIGGQLLGREQEAGAFDGGGPGGGIGAGIAGIAERADNDRVRGQPGWGGLEGDGLRDLALILAARFAHLGFEADGSGPGESGRQQEVGASGEIVADGVAAGDRQDTRFEGLQEFFVAVDPQADLCGSCSAGRRDREDANQRGFAGNEGDGVGGGLRGLQDFEVVDLEARDLVGGADDHVVRAVVVAVAEADVGGDRHGPRLGGGVPEGGGAADRAGGVEAEGSRGGGRNTAAGAGGRTVALDAAFVGAGVLADRLANRRREFPGGGGRNPGAEGFLEDDAGGGSRGGDGSGGSHSRVVDLKQGVSKNRPGIRRCAVRVGVIAGRELGNREVQTGTQRDHRRDFGSFQTVGSDSNFTRYEASGGEGPGLRFRCHLPEKEQKGYGRDPGTHTAILGYRGGGVKLGHIRLRWSGQFIHARS